MQTLHDADHTGTRARVSTSPGRFLEDSDGVVRRYWGDRLIAKLYSCTHDDRVSSEVSWRRWSATRLVWSQNSALLFLQGASLQQLLSPLLILYGLPVPITEPEPGMVDVVLAEVHEVPDSLTYPELFQLLVPEARGA